MSFTDRQATLIKELLKQTDNPHIVAAALIAHALDGVSDGLIKIADAIETADTSTACSVDELGKKVYAVAEATDNIACAIRQAGLGSTER